MKQHCAAIITATVLSFFSATAAPETPSEHNTVQVAVKGSFKQIVICDNVDVVLVEGTSSQISIKGKAKWSQAVKLEVKGGVLTVGSRRPSSMKQAVVYIPVQGLESITVKGYSDVQSQGTLHSEQLNIRIEGECRVNVFNSGPVHVVNGPGHGFDYEVKRSIRL